MAAFAASATGSQDSTGRILTLTDTSNYTTNDEGYIISDFTTRQFVLYDAYGEEIETLDLGAELEVEYDIPLGPDPYIQAVLILAGVGDYTDTIDLPLDRITQNLYRNLLKKGCCTSQSVENALMHADMFFTGSEFEAPLEGGAPGFQADINAAYAYLNAVTPRA